MSLDFNLKQFVNDTNLIKYFYLDTRTTQWEDPRLNNPKIAGPVSLILLYII